LQSKKDILLGANVFFYSPENFTPVVISQRTNPSQQGFKGGVANIHQAKTIPIYIINLLIRFNKNNQ
jgi:hypothetical protein